MVDRMVVFWKNTSNYFEITWLIWMNLDCVHYVHCNNSLHKHYFNNMDIFWKMLIFTLGFATYYFYTKLPHVFWDKSLLRYCWLDMKRGSRSPHVFNAILQISILTACAGNNQFPRASLVRITNIEVMILNSSNSVLFCYSIKKILKGLWI